MDKKLAAAINEQINAELYSSYLYNSMAENFKHQNWDGVAHWFSKQAEEETVHAKKFMNFLNDRGVKVELKAIKAPKTEWAEALDAFEDAYKHEKLVTGLINGLADLAAKVDDKPAEILLQWYITEQVEEEKSTSYVVEKLKIVKPNTGGFFLIDKQLGKRGEK